MGQEIEAKYRVADHDELRRRLRQAGAQLAGRALETDTFFDYPDADLHRQDCGLRVRLRQAVNEADAPEGGKTGTCTVTYKGPRRPGRYKIRRQVETAIDDAGAMRELLEALGLHATLTFQKRRESWRLEGCAVELDELPRLGCFVEIEGPEAAIEAVAERLGLADEPVEKAGYADLLDDLRRQEDLGTTFIFPAQR